MPISEITMYGKGHASMKKNIAKAYQTMLFAKWINGAKEEHNFIEIAPKDTKMRIEVMFWGHKSFVGLCSLDFENETFSQHHCHNKFRRVFDFNPFFENLKNGSIDLYKMLIMHAW